MDKTEYLRERQVRTEFLKIAHSTLWRWVACGSFPTPVRLGPRVTAWRRSDLEAWAKSRDGARA